MKRCAADFKKEKGGKSVIAHILYLCVQQCQNMAARSKRKPAVCCDKEFVVGHDASPIISIKAIFIFFEPTLEATHPAFYDTGYKTLNNVTGMK